MNNIDSSIVVKNNGTVIFRRDYSRRDSETHIAEIIKDMSHKGLINIKLFQKALNESLIEAKHETSSAIKETFEEISDNMADNVITSANKLADRLRL